MKESLSKPEAEMFLMQARKNWESKFCPLLKQDCNINCISYFPGSVEENPLEGGFLVRKPECTCHALVGELK